MISAYHRPRTLDEAYELVKRPSPVTLPLGGGTFLSHHRGEPIEVVDLQGLGLNRIRLQGKTFHIGATATLQQLLELPETVVALKRALELETPLNLRNVATVAGTVMACDGRSSFVTVLLALDAVIHLRGFPPEELVLGEFLPLRHKYARGTIITELVIPQNVQVRFEYVSRTPAASPIVCLALAAWPSGRIRLAIGGHGGSPSLAMDGMGTGGLEDAARNALHEAGDPWGSAEYRMDVGAVLARRCLESLNP